MKKEILQTLKIVALSLIFSASFAFATWVAMPANPVPPTAPANNIPTPINVGSTAQVKTGGLSTNTLAVFGSSQMNGNVNIKNDLDSSAGNLYVTGKLGVGVNPSSTSEKLEVVGNIKISSLSHMSGSLSNLCADNLSGEIFLCPSVQPAGNISFTTPATTTWTVPADVTTATFEVWGAGAGGGGGIVGGTTLSTTLYPGVVLVDGAGGGGGGYYKTTLTVTPGDTYSITVGAHGNGGNGVTLASNATGSAGSGSVGGLSKVINPSSTIIAQANGGSGTNTGATNTTMGTGGLGGTSNTGVSGSSTNGHVGLNPNTNTLAPSDNCSNGGAAGNGAIGGRGGLRLPVSSPICNSVSVNGSNGSQPGGGGGGGGWSINLGMAMVPGNGGNGGDGKVKISW